MMPTAETPPSSVERLRLNLGCADRYIDGWTNVDWEHSPHRKDQTVNLASARLPWAPGSISQVYCGHLFEHLSRFQCYQLAANLLQLAAPVCTIMVVGPDMHLIRQMIDRGEYLSDGHSFHSLRDGAHRWQGDEHLWETTGDAVWRILKEAGWPVVQADTVRNAAGHRWPVADPGPQWQYAIYGYTGPLSGFPGKKSLSGSS